MNKLKSCSLNRTLCSYSNGPDNLNTKHLNTGVQKVEISNIAGVHWSGIQILIVSLHISPAESKLCSIFKKQLVWYLNGKFEPVVKWSGIQMVV